MDKFMCVMAGFDKETEAYLQSLQDKLYANGFEGKQTKDIPMHITLAALECEKEEELVKLMKELPEKIKPFEVEFHHMGIFGGGEVLFAAPDINRDLLELKELFGDSKGWTPHTTMLIDKQATILEAENILLSEFKQFTGRIEKVYLYEFFPARYIECSMLDK